MDIQDKTKEELLLELKELQAAYDILQISLERDFLEQKNTEEALRRSEENLLITLHSIGDGVITTDKKGLVVRMNPVAEKLCGWQLIDAVGKPLAEVFKIVNAETRRSVADPVNKVLEYGEIVGLANHTVLISKNGNEYQIADSAAPIKNKEGEITGVVLVFSDVTENYTIQKQIKINEERNRSLLNNLEAGIIVHAPDTSIIMNNHRASELLGLSENQMKGKVAIDPAWHFVNEDKCPLSLEEYPVNRIVNTQLPIQNQIYGINQPSKKDIVWVTVNGFPVLNFDGEIIEIVISFIDITQGKHAEKNLKQRERELSRQNELFNALIKNLPMGVFMVAAPTGKPLVANDAALRLLGRGILPDASKHNLAEVYHAYKADVDHPYPIDEMPIIRGMNGEYSYIDDMIVLKPDGSISKIEVFGSPVKDEDGNVWASLVSFSDITQRKKTEESLRESEELFSLFMQFSPVYTYIKEVTPTESRVLISSDNFVEMIGLSCKEMKGKTMHELYPPDFATKITQDDWAVVTNKKVCQIEEQYENKYYTTIKFPIERKDKTLVAGYTIDITEQKQAEQLLTESQNRMDEAQKLAHIGVWDWDAQTDKVIWSNVLYEITGRDPLLPAPTFAEQADLYTPECSQMLIAAVDQAMKNGTEYQIELDFYHSDGSIRNAKAHGGVKVNSSGEIIGLFGTLQDITEQKQLEDVQHFLVTSGFLSSDKPFFKSLTEYLSKILDVEYVSIDKLDGDGLTAQPLANYYAGEFNANFQYSINQSLGSALVGKTICWYPENVRTLFPQNEVIRHFKAQSSLGSTLWSFDGKPIGLITIIGKKPLNNPTFAETVMKMVAIRAAGEIERIQMEEELRENELKYRQIFDNTFDIMAIYEVTEDRRFKVIAFNAAEARLIGPIEYYQNRYIDECIPPDLYLEFKKHYERCLDEEQLITYEENIIFQDIHKTFHTQLIPLKNSAGRIHRIIVISRDITENMQLQTQLIDQNEKLKLLNIDLIASKNKAEESDRLKSAFLANMSHEIRTPMNGILGFAEILSDSELTGEEQKEYLKIIQKSGIRMLNIINDIIDISKLESGLMKIDLKESNINEQMEYIYTFFKPEVEAKKMTLSIINTLPTKEALLITDREKLYAILTNLVKNAIKYSNEGTIEFGYHLTKDKTIEFFVKDTGVGIPEDRQAAIFERFIQADISNKNAKQGAGLGLAISKSFVEMLGGKIWVESKVGIGSTFYFTLPYTFESDEVDKAKDLMMDDKTNDLTNKLDILIADDDEISEMLVSINLKGFSKNIFKAKTGLEAIECCRANPNIDLILMDIQMPNLNGYEATRQIRQFNKDVVIIAQTAYGLSADREKAMEAGCNDYIAKPINKEVLKLLIQKYFFN